MNSFIALLVIGTFLLSLIGTHMMRRYALYRKLLDIPNRRSSHVLPTPRGGGVAIVATFLAAVLLLASTGKLDPVVAGVLAIGGGITAAIGFMDDHQPQPVSVRFGVHMAAAFGAVILIGGVPDETLVRWGLHSSIFGAILAVTALVWLTNLFNFMDGIDGIAAGEAAFISISGAWLNWHFGGDRGLSAAMLCLGAASLGFLCWNWPPARIFMGDAGSGFLGFSLAFLGLAASRSGSLPIEVWVILSGTFLVDSTVTLLSRIVRGDRWYEAHRSHAYQHLSRKWQAHSPVTLVVLAINVFWLLPFAVCAASHRRYAPFLVLIALAPLVAVALVAGAGKPDEKLN
jgi:Fuc2NAc and GlcNAc transferase